MTEELEEHILAAAKIAEKVAPELRVVAFERAADELIGSKGSRTSRKSPSRFRRKSVSSSSKKGDAKKSASGSGGRAQLQELIKDGYFKQASHAPRNRGTP